VTRQEYDGTMAAGIAVLIYLVMLGLSIVYLVWFIRSMNAVREATTTLTNQMVTLSKQIAQIASFVRPASAVTPSGQPATAPVPVEPPSY